MTNDQAGGADERANPDRPPAEGGREEVDEAPAGGQHAETPAPHADPDYDEPGDNPLAAEDDDD